MSEDKEREERSVKREEKGKPKDRIEVKIEEVKEEVREIRDTGAKRRFEGEIREIEKLRQTFPPNTLLGVFVEALFPRLEIIGEEAVKLKTREAARERVEREDYRGIGWKTARNTFLEGILGDQSMAKLTREEKAKRKEDWFQLLEQKGEGERDVLEQRVKKDRETSLSRIRGERERRVEGIGEISGKELEDLARYLKQAKGKEITLDQLKRLVRAGQKTLNLEFNEARKAVEEVLVSRQERQELPVDRFLARLRMIKEGRIDDPQWEKENLRLEAEVIKEYCGEKNLPSGFEEVLTKSLHKLNQLHQGKESEFQTRRGAWAGVEALKGKTPEEIQRPAQRERGAHYLYLTDADIQKIDENAYLYFRRQIAWIHSLSGAEKSTFRYQIQQAQSYWRTSYETREGPFVNLSPQEAKELHDKVAELNNAYFSASYAYDVSGNHQDPEERNKTQGFFGVHELGYFDQNWGFNLFKAVFEQENVAKAFLRIGDREEWLDNSLEKMRGFINRYLEYCLETKNDQTNRVLAQLFYPNEYKKVEEKAEKLVKKRELAGEKKGEWLNKQIALLANREEIQNNWTGRKAEDEKSFGILEEEMPLFFNVYDWMGRIPAFDALYKDTDFWMPYDEKNEGSPFMPEDSKLFIIYGFLHFKKGEDRKIFLEELEKVKDEKGNYKYRRKSEAVIKRQVLEEIKRTATWQKERYSDDEILNKAYEDAFVDMKYYELFRRAAMGTGLRKVIGMHNQAKRDTALYPNLVELVDRENHFGDWHTNFFEHSLKDTMDRSDTYLKQDAVLNFLGKELEGVKLDKEKKALTFNTPDSEKTRQVLADTLNRITIPGREYAGRKKMNIDDWHSGALGMTATWGPLKEIMQNPMAAVVEGKVEELYQALGGENYFKEAEYEKSLGLLDNVFGRLLGEPIAKTKRQKIRLDMYKNLFRNMKTSYETKKNIFYYLKRMTYPPVDATAPFWKRSKARFRNWLKFQRESLYVLGKWEIVYKKGFISGLKILTALFFAALKEVMAGTELEESGIDPTKL
jgi:hypothetical protein